MGFDRTASIEAIASSLGAKTQSIPGRESHRIPPEDAAMALCGADSLAVAFWELSMGHDDPANLSICAGYLLGCAAWEAEAERWRAGRLERLVALCLEELSRGYAAESAKFTETSRARWMGMSERNWHLLGWKRRYGRVMRDAMAQVNAAQEAIGRRVVG